MPDLLQSAATFLQQQRHAHMAHLVEYRQGGSETGRNLKATVGKSSFESRNSSGDFPTDIETMDFTFRSSDLNVDGVLFEPSENDRILRTVGTKVRTYAPVKGAGDKYFRYEDMDRTALRIHTVMITEVAA